MGLLTRPIKQYDPNFTSGFSKVPFKGPPNESFSDVLRASGSKPCQGEHPPRKSAPRRKLHLLLVYYPFFRSYTLAFDYRFGVHMGLKIGYPTNSLKFHGWSSHLPLYLFTIILGVSAHQINFDVSSFHHHLLTKSSKSTEMTILGHGYGSGTISHSLQ